MPSTVMPVQTKPRPGIAERHAVVAVPAVQHRRRHRMRHGGDRRAAPDPARRRIAHPGLPVALAQVAGLHAAQRIGMIVIERAGRRVGLAGEPELLQAGQELLEMLAAEVAEDVLPRGVLAAPRDQPQDQGRHQRVVERADRAVGGQPAAGSAIMAVDEDRLGLAGLQPHLEHRLVLGRIVEALGRLVARELQHHDARRASSRLPACASCRRAR